MRDRQPGGQRALQPGERCTIQRCTKLAGLLGELRTRFPGRLRPRLPSQRCTKQRCPLLPVSLGERCTKQRSERCPRRSGGRGCQFGNFRPNASSHKQIGPRTRSRRMIRVRLIRAEVSSSLLVTATRRFWPKCGRTSWTSENRRPRSVCSLPRNQRRAFARPCLYSVYCILSSLCPTSSPRPWSQPTADGSRPTARTGQSTRRG